MPNQMNNDVEQAINESQAKTWGALSDYKPDNIDNLLLNKEMVELIGAAIRARQPDVRIIGIEPVGSPTLKACVDAGEVVTLPEVTTRVPTMACARTVGLAW